MPDHVPAYKFDKDQFSCPKCGMAFESAPVVTGKPTGMRKGHIMVCSGCAGVLRLGDDGFREMPPSEIAKLPQPSQQTINITKEMVLANIGHSHRKNNGS